MDLFPRDGAKDEDFDKMTWMQQYYEQVAELKQMRRPPPVEEMQKPLAHHQRMATLNFWTYFGNISRMKM